MLATFLTWLGNWLAGIITPLIQSAINNSVMAARVADLENQNTALIKAVGELQSAQTPAQEQQAIKDIATADNSN